MGIFNSRPSAQKMGMEFSNSICVEAAYGTNRVKAISMIIGDELNLEQYVNIYLELVIYQIHIVDKMASKSYGSDFRTPFINSLIDNAKLSFLEAKAFRGLSDNMNYYFEKYFHDTFYIYPSDGSILGNDSNQVTIFLARRLANIIVNIEEDAKYRYAETLIYEMLEGFVKEILSEKPLKMLVGSSK